uniref:Uncharacterized protein n=1 Tax=Vespula pensylvanica TaxID=30213 RepID=A0A834NK28_VESPE|nr:hypothetical protein H0235_013326 [Vespula pensylvanica]
MEIAKRFPRESPAMLPEERTKRCPFEYHERTISCLQKQVFVSCRQFVDDLPPRWTGDETLQDDIPRKPVRLKLK